jgi:hypothetical protein
MKKGQNYFVIGCHVLWREISSYASISENIINLKFLRQGLHCTPDLLRKELQEAIDEVDGNYDAILIGYGLCSNGTQGITSKKTKLVIMKGHDCITFLLGSKERYRNYFDGNPGTYWYTPGWIDTSIQPSKERYELLLNEYMEKYGEENAEYLMEMEQGWFKEYSNAAYVDLGFMDNSRYKEYTRECADWLNWKYDELQGDSRLITNFLNGNWSNEDFLIVEPGNKIIASNDERILDVVKE